MSRIFAVDLGGTKLQSALVEDGQIRNEEIVSTNSDFLSQLHKICDGRLTGRNEVDAIAIGVPGPVKQGVMLGSRPLACNQNINFIEELACYSIPVIVRNDLHMAAHAEVHLGIGRTCNNFAVISLSTGIGVAIVSNGQVLDGRTEMGHQVIDRDFVPLQQCTNHVNCWASLASGEAIVKRFATDTKQTAEYLFDQVLGKNDLNELKNINACAIGNIISAYDPDNIIIMGSMGLAQFNKIVPDSALIERFTINRPIPKISKTTFQHQIGILGSYYAAAGALNG